MPFADDRQPGAQVPSALPTNNSPFALTCPVTEYLLPPRLGIIHLLAWTAVTAMLMKFNLALQMPKGGTDVLVSPSRAIETVLSVVLAVYAVIYAAGLVGTAVLLMTKARRTPGNFQPGHWVLLVDTTIMVMFYLSGAQLMRDGEIPPLDFTWYLVMFPLVSLFCAPLHTIGYFVATAITAAPRRWKAFFLLRGSALLLQSGTYVVFGIFNCISPRLDPLSWGWLMIWPTTVGIALVIVVLVDVRKRVRRDWLHWTAVGMVATSVLLQIGLWVAMELIEPELVPITSPATVLPQRM